MRRPRTVGSFWNRRVHSVWLRTATRGLPGRSSEARNVRPLRTGARNSRKNSAVTRATGICSGSLPSVRLTYSRRCADTSSNTAVCGRQTSNDWAPAIDVEAPVVVMNRTSEAASGALSGRRTTAFTTEKIAVLALMPSVSVRIATRAKPGCRRRVRSA